MTAPTGRFTVPRSVVVGASVIALVVACAATPAAASAQAVGSGPLVQSYTFADPEAAGLESFRLLTLPFAASVPVARGLTLTAGGSYADGLAKGPLGQASLKGFTDTDVGLSFALGDWLVIGADATLATGKSSLTLEESLVASVVAADLVPFAITTWGAGGSVGSTVAVATQAGSWGVGLAGGYRVSGPFEPVPGQTLGYDPGNQLQVRAAFDRNVAGSSTLSFVFGFQQLGDDELLETNLFQAGSRVQGSASLAFPLGLRSSALVFGAVTHRSRGSLLAEDPLLAGAGDSPAQQLFAVGTNVRMPLGRNVALLPVAEMRVFRAEDGASQGWIASAGTSMDVRLVGNSASGRLVLAPAGQLRFGNVIVEEGAETGVFGWEASLILRVESGR